MPTMLVEIFEAVAANNPELQDQILAIGGGRFGKPKAGRWQRASPKKFARRPGTPPRDSAQKKTQSCINCGGKITGQATAPNSVLTRVSGRASHAARTAT